MKKKINGLTVSIEELKMIKAAADAERRSVAAFCSLAAVKMAEKVLDENNNNKR